MKKITALALALCTVLLLTVSAFADGRGPTFTSYEVVCPKDTPYYEENWDQENSTMKQLGTLPSGTTLKVDYEYENGGVLYGQVNLSKTEDNYEFAFIRLSDVELKNETYPPQKSEKLLRPRSVHVVAKDGIALHAGPNKKYDVVKQIPHGATLTYEYGNDEDDDYRTWGYVSYRGSSGWINVDRSDMQNGVAEIPYEEDKPEIWVLSDDVRMYDGYSFGNIADKVSAEEMSKEERDELLEAPNRVLGTLENGKKYTFRYQKQLRYYGVWYYVAAGLRSGWVFQKNCAADFAVSESKVTGDGFIVYSKFDLKLYSEPDQEAVGTNVRLTPNMTLEPEFEIVTDDGAYYYETLLGVSGWYYHPDVTDHCAHKIRASSMEGGYMDKVRSNSAAPIYRDPADPNSQIGSIPSGKKFEPQYFGSFRQQADDSNEDTWKSFYYVRYNGVSGWVIEDDLFSEDWTEPETREETTTEEEDTLNGDPHEPDASATNVTEEETDVTRTGKQNTLSVWQIMFACICAAVVLTLTAVVTLILIRRRHKAQ